MRILALLLFIGSASAQTTQTVTIPVQVTVSPTGTTVTIPAQTLTIPITTTPTCGAQPASTVATVACPAGSTGTWQQTTSYVSVATPVCWVPVLAPTTAPAGACTPIVTPPTANCGNVLGTAVTFCYTFDTPMPVAGTRTGALDPNVWGVSRALGQGVNFGQQQYGMWNQTMIQNCDGSTSTVVPPNDIIICNGQLREAANDNNSLTFDNGDVTSFAMYPKQPFDFAGRTGTVSFDVSNDSTGTHSVWPEFWMSDAPVPDPFNHFNSWQALPANGFAVRLGAVAPPGMQGTCPNSNNLTLQRWTVDSAAVVRGYVLDDTNGYGPGIVKMTPLDCVIRSSGPGNMNHVEIRISTTGIDVYATDASVAATATTLRHIATVTNANLTFTRGLVWLEDVHYNADKETSLHTPPLSASQRQHTFSWDNLAFDGPFTDRDFTYDAPDALTPITNGAVNLGKFSAAGQSSTWSIPNVPANPQAAAAKVLFDFNTGFNALPTVINVTVNGNKTVVPWPYPDTAQYDWRTLAVTIPLSNLVPGTNTVQLGTDVSTAFANVDIVLGNVTGGVPILPGSNNAYP